MPETDAPAAEPLTLANSYLRLPEACYARIEPTAVSNPQLLRLNRPLAEELGLDPDALAAEAGLAVLGGNRLPADCEPLALAYAGHQFGNWVPQLGDGRAVLLGEVTDRNGVRRDIQLKGAGRTPFSRAGDGRASLGPVIREYLVSEGMHGLGVPTTRALAMVATGDPVLRQRVEPGGVLTRVAASHVRVGTFEYFFRRSDFDALRALADFVIERHYPEIAGSETPYRDLLAAVATRTADLVADWLLVGFIHGVMNTDNIALSGETLDYGPCAFMDDYHPATVYSSIDTGGRYAYDQQPKIAHWDLARFAETLLPLLADDPDAALPIAREALDVYEPRFSASYHAGLRDKLGLVEARESDPDLAMDLLGRMAEQGADFTLTFRRLSELGREPGQGDAALRELFADPAAIDAWLARWRERLAAEDSADESRRAAMRAVNPAYIPRNHRVEAAITAAMDRGDLGPIDDLLTVVTDPFADHPGYEHLAAPPAPHEVVTQTFCGT
jgi:uncharacterized protein YdiU (UPF0061 family)